MWRSPASARAAASSSRRSGGLLAAFFGGGGGADDEEDSSGVTVASGGDDEAAAPQPAKPARVAKARLTKPTPAPRRQRRRRHSQVDNKIRILPPELANPVDLPPVAQQETIVAALPARDVPLPLAAPRPQVDVGAVDSDLDGLYASADQPAPGDSQRISQPSRKSRSTFRCRRRVRATRRRPNSQADSRDQAVIVAAATAETASDMDLPLPVARPSEHDDRDEIAPLIAALPDEEPGEEPDEGEDVLHCRVRAGRRIGERCLPDIA